jgi:hypothetical protein
VAHRNSAFTPPWHMDRDTKEKVVRSPAVRSIERVEQLTDRVFRMFQ